MAGRFHIDSGAGGFLDFNSHFVRTHDLAERVGATHEQKGRGLTEVRPTDKIGRVAGVKFCGYTFPAAGPAPNSLPALLSGATAGVLARSGLGGLIGNAILSRFNIVFDLERSRIYLQPNSHWDDPIRSDASGLQLIRQPDGTTVIEEIVARSPGAAARLAPGDELRSINDVDSSTLTLADLRDRLREPDRKFSLVVIRDGVASTIGLHSRAVIALDGGPD